MRRLMPDTESKTRSSARVQLTTMMRHPSTFHRSVMWYLEQKAHVRDGVGIVEGGVKTRFLLYL